MFVTACMAKGAGEGNQGAQIFLTVTMTMYRDWLVVQANT